MNGELTEVECFREKISTMSFEDLLKLKDNIGTKEYNKTVLGSKVKKSEKSYKRANKNRPRETTSKRPVSVKDTINQTKLQPSRDPRFDPLCGVYDDTVFKSNYKFVQDIKRKECAQLKKEYNNEEEQPKKATLKFLMTRMDNQLREFEKVEKLRVDKQQEQAYIKRELMKGEKPVFKQKSVKRIEDLIDKFEDLKKSNKLQKHFAKRYKKQIEKDRKTMNSFM